MGSDPENEEDTRPNSEFQRAGKKLDSYNTVYNHQGLTHARVLGDACLPVGEEGGEGDACLPVGEEGGEGDAYLPVDEEGG